MPAISRTVRVIRHVPQRNRSSVARVLRVGSDARREATIDWSTDSRPVAATARSMPSYCDAMKPVSDSADLESLSGIPVQGRSERHRNADLPSRATQPSSLPPSIPAARRTRRARLHAHRADDHDRRDRDPGRHRLAVVRELRAAQKARTAQSALMTIVNREQAHCSTCAATRTRSRAELLGAEELRNDYAFTIVVDDDATPRTFTTATPLTSRRATASSRSRSANRARARRPASTAIGASDVRAGRSPTAPPRRRAGGGFTLVELLTVVSIVAILVAVAAPSFGAMLAAQRVHAADVGAERVAVARARRGHQAKHRRRLLDHRSASGLDDSPSDGGPDAAPGAGRLRLGRVHDAGWRRGALHVQRVRPAVDGQRLRSRSATSTPASSAASSSRPPAAPPRRRDRAHDAPRSPPAGFHPGRSDGHGAPAQHRPARPARPPTRASAGEFESYQRGQAIALARDMQARLLSARGIVPGYLDPTISSVDG